MYRLNIVDGIDRISSLHEASQVTNRSLLTDAPLNSSSYFIIKAKSQMWNGMPAIAIFMNDVSKKIYSIMNEKRAEEEREKARQAENFT